MRVAAVQFEPVRGDVGKNLDALRVLVEEAAADANLVVCPEMAPSGYLFADRQAASRVAEPPLGPTFTALAPIARRHRALVVCGFAEQASDGRLYNSALLIDPGGGLLAVYRKTLLYPPDARWAEPGDSGYVAIDTPWGRVGVGVCMDLNDDRFVDYVARALVDVVAFPTNWVASDDYDVATYWQERLGRTGATLVAANRWGGEDDVVFSGRSAVLNSRAVLAGGPRTGDCVVRSDVPVLTRSP